MTDKLFKVKIEGKRWLVVGGGSPPIDYLAEKYRGYAKEYGLEDINVWVEELE